MKTRPLKNGYYGSVGCEIYDINFATASDEELIEVGKIVEDQLTVFIGQDACGGIDSKKHFEIQEMWGTPYMGLIHAYVGDGRLAGPHWDDFLENLRDVSKKSDIAFGLGASEISYQKDEHGKPIGMFADGELDWHSAEAGMSAAPRTIGLSSVAGSVNSRTDFLQTFDMWEKLSETMQSELKELSIIHKWRPEGIAYGTQLAQQEIARFNTVAIDGQQTKLYSETASGRPGIRFPAYSFDGFVGMSEVESWKLYAHLSKLVYDPCWIYQHEWQDGQVMYFDQEISIHRRPTNVEAGSDRRMVRKSFYFDKLYPDAAPLDYVEVKGKKYTNDEYAAMVDKIRLADWEAGITAGQLK